MVRTRRYVLVAGESILERISFPPDGLIAYQQQEGYEVCQED